MKKNLFSFPNRTTENNAILGFIFFALGLMSSTAQAQVQPATINKTASTGSIFVPQFSMVSFSYDITIANPNATGTMPFSVTDTVPNSTAVSGANAGIFNPDNIITQMGNNVTWTGVLQANESRTMTIFCDQYWGGGGGVNVTNTATMTCAFSCGCTTPPPVNCTGGNCLTCADILADADPTNDFWCTSGTCQYFFSGSADASVWVDNQPFSPPTFHYAVDCNNSIAWTVDDLQGTVASYTLFNQSGVDITNVTTPPAEGELVNLMCVLSTGGSIGTSQQFTMQDCTIPTYTYAFSNAGTQLNFAAATGVLAPSLFYSVDNGATYSNLHPNTTPFTNYNDAFPATNVDIHICMRAVYSGLGGDPLNTVCKMHCTTIPAENATGFVASIAGSNLVSGQPSTLTAFASLSSTAYTYQWTNGTANLGTNVSINVSPTVVATYTVTITTARGNSATASFRLPTVVSVENISNTARFTVSPNPTTNSIYINSNDELLFGTSILLFDILGKQLQTTLLKATNQALDISAYPAGMYVLKIGNTSAKIVKE